MLPVKPCYSACCRAGIHLRLFEAIANSEGPITASELAAKTGSEHLLVGEPPRSLSSICRR